MEALSAGAGGAPLPNGLVVVDVAVVPDVVVVVAAGFAPKSVPALAAGAAVLDDAAGAVVVVAENKEGVVAGAEAAAGAVVEAVDAGVPNNDGLDGADEVAVVEPPRLGKRDGVGAAAVVAAVLAGAVVVEAAGFVPKRLLPPPPLVSAGLAAAAPPLKRDGVEVPLVEAPPKGLGFSAAPVEAGFAPKRLGVPELLAAGCDAGVEADPPPKRLELVCDVDPAAPPPKRLLVCDPWPPAGWLKRLGVGLPGSEGGAPAGVVDPRPPNIGFVGVACPAEAVENKELPVLVLVEGVELAAGLPPPKRLEPPPKGLAPVEELAPAAVVGVLEPPPNTLDDGAAGLFSPEKREFPLPAGGVPVEAAPPNNEPEDGDALVVELPPNNEGAAGLEALLPPKRPPPDAAGCPAAPALSFCALPKEKPVEGVEDWFPNSEVAAGVDEDDAPEVAWVPKEKDMLDAGVFQQIGGALSPVRPVDMKRVAGGRRKSCETVDMPWISRNIGRSRLGRLTRTKSVGAFVSKDGFKAAGGFT